jgi:hypothetical protein
VDRLVAKNPAIYQGVAQKMDSFQVNNAIFVEERYQAQQQEKVRLDQQAQAIRNQRKALAASLPTNTQENINLQNHLNQIENLKNSGIQMQPIRFA